MEDLITCHQRAALAVLSDHWNCKSEELFAYRRPGNWLGTHYKQTTAALDGPFSTLRGWGALREGLGKVRRRVFSSVNRLSRIPFALPSDAFMFSKWDGNLLVVASASRNAVAKIAVPGHQAENLAREYELVEELRQTSLAPHIATVLNFQIGAPEPWTLLNSELIQNRMPFLCFNRDQNLNRFLSEAYGPIILQHFREAGFPVHTPSEWFELLLKKTTELPASQNSSCY